MTSLETKFLEKFLKEQNLLNTFRLNVVNFGFSRWVSVEHYFLSVKDPLNAIKFAFPFDGAMYGKPINWWDVHYDWIVELLGKKASPSYRRFGEYYTAGEVMQLLKYLDSNTQVSDPNSIKLGNEITIHDLIEISDVRRFNTIQKEKEKKQQTKTVKTEPKPIVTKPTTQVDSDFEFIDFAKISYNKNTNQRTIRLYSKGSKHCCIFSAPILTELRENKLPFMRLRKDKLTNELYVVFTKDTGLPINLDIKKSSLEVNSKDLFNFLCDAMCSKHGDVLNLSENKANSKDFCTYKITKP